MEFVRAIVEFVRSEGFAHQIGHMSLHAFKHFVEHGMPHIWESVRDNIGEIFSWIRDIFF